jgi:hypothetical protein
MAIVFDQGAQAAIQHRRERGKETAITLCVTPLKRGAYTVSVGWGHRHSGQHIHQVEQVGDAQVFLDPRLARFARWRDIVISGGRLGPFDFLRLTDPFPMRRVAEWERTHPALRKIS